MTFFEKIRSSSYRGFHLTKEIDLPELKCTLREITHDPSGANILHLENGDPENLFCLCFQTLPMRSNGVAHILEHTVLCGSKKFPIKDPFFSMNRRSLNTFMNALTGSDFTCYPAATQIEKDFYNLLDVYLDAVFHPLLNPFSFQQEGHRLEFENPKDPGTPLIIRGIVYNEMKGAMNSASSRMHEALYHALFPDLTYGVNSGGDPLEIPTLSHEDLLNFYETFYHPSRCLFFFYGDLPLQKHLDFIEERILKKAERKPPLPLIPPQKRFETPKRIQESYPVAADEQVQGKTILSFGWLTCHILEQDTCLALEILELILLGTDASPLKKAFLKSGLCKQVSSFVDAEISEIPFGIQLKGCNPEDADEIETVLFSTLQDIVEKGLPTDSMENAIHQLEFERSEITGDFGPFGLTLFMRSALLKQHGGRPEFGLLIHTLFDRIRKKCAENPRFFVDLLQKYLLLNPHLVRVTLTPDPILERKESLTEKERLETLQSSLNPIEKEELVEKAEALKQYQEKQEEEDIEVLPKVSLEDVPKESHELPLSQETCGNLQIFHHDCFTNEIGYADLFFDLPPLDRDELMLTRFLSVVLPQSGTKGKPYEEILEYIQANTGGVTSYLSLHIQAEDYRRFSPSLTLRGKALYRKLRKMFPLLGDIAASADLQDKARLKEILLKHHTGLESTLSQSALKYAVNLSAAAVSLPSTVANFWYGIDYYRMIRNLAKQCDKEDSIEELMAKLKDLKQKILSQVPDLVLGCDKNQYEILKGHELYGLTGIQTEAKKEWSTHLILPSIKSQGRIIASPVAFIARAFPTVSYFHPDAPLLSLAASIFDHVILHKKIREEGGAYGGGASSNTLSGSFYFYSYRDPHIYRTLEAFETAIYAIEKGQFDEGDLEEAKFDVIQNFDTPIAPGSRADVAYSRRREGKTQAMRQSFRDRILGATCEDIIQAVVEHIRPHFDQGKIIVFAGEKLFEKENGIFLSEGKMPLEIRAMDDPIQ